MPIRVDIPLPPNVVGHAVGHAVDQDRRGAEQGFDVGDLLVRALGALDGAPNGPV